MKRNIRSHSVILVCLLAIGLASMVLAEEQSGCVTCHLDSAMLSKHLSGAKSKTSAIQSGSAAEAGCFSNMKGMSLPQSL